MAINFGGVIAGIDEEWTRQITRREKREDKELDRVASLEDARTLADYRVKLGTDESNRTERKRLEKWGTDTAGTLKAMGATDSQIKAIIAAGEGAGNQVVEAAKLGYTNQGADFDVQPLFEVFGTDTKRMTNVVNKMPSQIDKALDTSSSGSFFSSAMGDAYGKPEKQYASLTAIHAGIVQNMLNTTDQDELAKLEGEEKIILAKINAVDTENSERKFSFSDMNKKATRYRKERLSAVGIKTGIEGELLTELGGQKGKFHIAEARAVGDLETFNNSFDTPDVFLTSEIARKKDSIEQALNSFAASVLSNTALDAGDDNQGTFSYKKPKVTKDQLTQNLKKGMYRDSDIVQVGQATYVYVGYDSFLADKTPEGIFPFHLVEFYTQDAEGED